MADSLKQRFYSLDVLRGVAALAVVFWHWRHFCVFHGMPFPSIAFSRLMLPFFLQGYRAVDLFFCLSGFIFHWLYSSSVAEGRMPAARFALLRFSRLYPLHIVTLVLVALGQMWFVRVYGRPFIYESNDAYRFVLHLSLTNGWGLRPDILSFNGPVWSVSVEVFLYGLFFLCCRMFPVRAIGLLVLAAFGYMMRSESPFLGEGISFFFVGGATFLLYRKIVESYWGDLLRSVVAGLALVAWIVSLTFVLRFGVGNDQTTELWTLAVLFPLTILALALLETRWREFARPLAFIGDISYSSYMLHFPLQMLATAVVGHFIDGWEVFYSWWFMVAFTGTLVGMSLVSYRWLEMPAQRWLRNSKARLSGPCV